MHSLNKALVKDYFSRLTNVIRVDHDGGIVFDDLLPTIKTPNLGAYSPRSMRLRLGVKEDHALADTTAPFPPLLSHFSKDYLEGTALASFDQLNRDTLAMNAFNVDFGIAALIVWAEENLLSGLELALNYDT